jgi:tetratricopeptide (TPR) repeat protein
MHASGLWLALALVILAAPDAVRLKADATNARVWEAPLTIPTYELGPPNPYPAFPGWRGRSRPVYPYPMLDTLTDRRVAREHRAVFLENEYLKVTVLPDLGGRVYAIFDKVTGRDALYTNHVVKYGMVGIRGAWISGGIEWNFPDGHTVTSVSPVDHTTRTEADGSAVVVVGDTERIQRMQWAIEMRLRPGMRRLETVVTLNNRREVPGRYWYWSTAAAPAADDMRFVYPMREAYPHRFWPIYSFPKHAGVDLSTYREVPNALSLFARNSMRDFFGVYYERSDQGIVHVADHRDLPGKKTWTWGTADSGQIWIEKLTDNDGQYVEFQAGRFETQMEHEFIAPHRVERFVEYWYPVNGLGGAWDEATADVALRVSVRDGRAHVTVSPTGRHDTAQVKVHVGDAHLPARRVNLTPERLYTADFKLPSASGTSPVSVAVIAQDGRILARHDTGAPVDGNPDFTPATRPPVDPQAPSSAEQVYLRGVAADKKSDERGARAAYRDALTRDAGFVPAHVALGLSFYRTGEWDTAAEHLTAALRRRPDALDGHYYLGLVRRAQGRTRDAARHLEQAARAGYLEPVARYLLGEIALADGDFQEGRWQLAAAVRLDPRDLKARTMLALAERLVGKLDDARGRIDAVVQEMPIDYFALREQLEVHKARRDAQAAARVDTELSRLLAREPDSVLELAFDYLAAGQNKAAAQILRESKTSHPMVHYTLGCIAAISDDREGARKHYAAARAADPAFVFPHRVEEILVLRKALEEHPDDARAAYYLGNALAANYRDAEAVESWRAALRREPPGGGGAPPLENAVAHRNVARALSLEGKADEAVEGYGQAIALAPADVHLYLERDQILAQQRSTDRRIALLERAPDTVRARAAVAQALAAAYVEAERFADAIALLQGTKVTSGEGESSALGTYQRARRGLAREHQRAGRHLEAAAEFQRAAEYPRNLGVGRPPRSHAREDVAAARELEAAGRHEEAGPLWRRAAEEPIASPVEPNEPWSEHNFYKGVALEQVGRTDEARALYERLAALADDQRVNDLPDAPGGAVRFALASLALEALGRQDEARRARTRALEIDPHYERR